MDEMDVVAEMDELFEGLDPDIVADIEDALLRNVDMLFAAVGYSIYLDSFDHVWVPKFPHWIS